MALSEDKINAYSKRLLLSRMRILINNGFYGLLLMHMRLTIDEECTTAATDGHRIYFSPKFLDMLSDKELDFVMMHEILHVALRHCQREDNRDQLIFNIACDIVVNSNILLSNNMSINSITLKNFGASMHLTPNKEEGYKYTAEEVYEMLIKSGKFKDNLKNLSKGKNSDDKNNSAQNNSKNIWDDHTRWQNDSDSTENEIWTKRVIDAVEAIEIQQANATAALPLFAKRLLKELKKPQTDWRTILSEFVQEEICDYSFSPPDRRFDDSPFFLPDFNETETIVSDILFMVDTSASMSNEMITAAFSEIKGAIEQFNGKLKGWLGFFDAAIVEPKPFETMKDFEVIHPVGGGGTNFKIIFDYVNSHMQSKLPASIIILTDGYAPFPNKAVTNDIPVLWLINNKKVTPPWGKIARIKV